MKCKVVLILVFLLFVSVQAEAEETRWKSLKKGLEYSEIRVSPGIIHAFRINPRAYNFGIVTSKDLGRPNSTVRDMAKAKSALVAINGGFFTPEFDSLGLLISNYKEINPLKKTSWWSVFFIRDSVPEIVHTSSFKKDSSVSVAVQCGPRLLIGGNIPKLKSSIAERSAVCIDSKRRVILIATDNLLVTPQEFAEYLRRGEKDGGLGCRDALNLDGGGSTQLYAHVGSFRLDVQGVSKVTNAVAVYRE